ncbi:MAG TPA: response regulator [Nitrososphaera sp.]|nr:response regulator [Nitrososphaera sp.]
MTQAILLVDQKQSTAHLMKTYLRADGWSVDHTPYPSEAIKFVAESKKYKVVITDLVMPDMSGLDLYREVRNYDEHIKFMFLLSISGGALRLMGSLDRDDIIKKEPLSINELICKVRAAFMNSR